MSWQIDKAHSDIQFSVRHMMISKVRGRFEDFSGAVKFNPENPAAGSVHIEIETDSVNTRNTDRDNHLRSADFFDAANFPIITFISKKVEQEDAHNGRLIGDLTIRGVTKEVALDVKYSGVATSPWGTQSAGFSASGEIDRKEFGLEWNQALEAGGVLVGDKVKLDIEVELMRQPEGELAAG